jgi:flagellar P-ring protein precursor FlgI
VLLVMLCVANSRAVQVQDIVRLKGSEGLPLMGVGLVVGLDGTGDKEFGPTHRALMEWLLPRQDDKIVVDELADVESVALVSLNARIPEHGAVAGDRLDVYVEAIGTAKSLRGGRLLVAPLQGPIPEPKDPEAPRPPGSGVYGMASGSLVQDDLENNTSAKVEQGLHIIQNVYPSIMDPAGRLQLVINDANASWPVAKNLAALINGLSPMGLDGELAMAISPKLVVVQVPQAERLNPAGFISRVLESYIHVSQVTSGSVVRINHRAQVITIDGSVEITPTVITTRGLTITRLTPEPRPTEVNPRIDEENFVALDPQKQGGAKLADLMDALNALSVPFEDRVNILKELRELGHLHAQVHEE